MNRRMRVSGLALIMGICVSAQSLSQRMQAVYDACVGMSMSVGSGSQTGLQAANKAFKACGVKEFTRLRLLAGKPLSLDGHFVFDEEFVDSLIAGRNVYKFAQRYAEKRMQRGVSGSGKVFSKTCAVGKQASVKYSFVSKGRQELAVVAEPGGRITLRVYDRTHDKWYNDTKEVKRGMPSRCMVFDLPDDRCTQLEVEVVNTAKRNISFVLISN